MEQGASVKSRELVRSTPSTEFPPEVFCVIFTWILKGEQRYGRKGLRNTVSENVTNEYGSISKKLGSDGYAEIA